MTSLGPLRNPVSLLLSRQPWAAAGYLLAYVAIGWVLLAVALTATFVGAGLSITVVGVWMLIAAAAAIRWCGDVERVRLRAFTGTRITGGYREFTGSGVAARLRHMWGGSQLWADIAYLCLLCIPLLTLDFGVLTVWLVFLAGITLPAWYQYPTQTWGSGATAGTAHGVQLGYFANGPHGHPGYGLYVDTLPKALLAAVTCLVLFLLFNYVVAGTARLHAGIARGRRSPNASPCGAPGTKDPSCSGGCCWWPRCS
jgi:hypothetical protein